MTTTIANLKRDIADAEEFLRLHGHTLFCGEQDRIADMITDMREELAELEF